MIDNFDGDAVGFGFVEGAGGVAVAVEGGQGFFVAPGFQRGLEGFVWIVGAEEVGFQNSIASFVPFMTHFLKR